MAYKWPVMLSSLRQVTIQGSSSGWSSTWKIISKWPFISDTGEGYAFTVKISKGIKLLESIEFYSEDGLEMAVCH